jgi:hypothetical protein
MKSDAPPETGKYGPWNPGIQSRLPSAYLPLVTIFRQENAFTGIDEIKELSAFTGLPREDLTVFRPERLVIHELLVRVTADISVPDGSHYGDLGINFREITETILARYIAPKMTEITGAHEACRKDIASLVAAELTPLFNVTGAKRDALALRQLEDWREQNDIPQTGMDASIRRALTRVVTAIYNTHGAIRGEQELLERIVTGMVLNDFGAEMIGSLIEPCIADAVNAEPIDVLPIQNMPVVMNVKGASASGKSTMRPLQRQLAERLGIEWRDFALISPDIWRKYLLDYDSLNGASKYAGTLTGYEIAIIDGKLDRYMARKAERTGMPHLLIDRFRFDSFDPRQDEEEGSRLLTRFGHLVYMFFMITPPEATVERAWKRGLQFGRYKAVDDLLDHNVEAFTGMPRLFFTWVLKPEKKVHFEFLDNSVAKGKIPRTVAFGLNGEMNILDVGCLIDVERYRKINIDAQSPDEVYPGPEELSALQNTGFLEQCRQRISVTNFVESETGRVYVRMEAGRVTALNREVLAIAGGDDDTRAGLEALAPGIFSSDFPAGSLEQTLQRSDAHTLGAWGQGQTPKL